MKKILALVLSCIVLLSFTACNEKDPADSSSVPSDYTSQLPSSTPPSVPELPPASDMPLTSFSSEIRVDQATSTVPMLDSTKHGWGQGTNKNKQNQPVDCLKYQEKYGKYNACFIEEKENTIYLTFDEGYENGYTATILDTLKQKNVKAVFFITYDYVNRNPDLVQRMIDEGHVVGNHTWSHPSMPTVDAARAKEEVTKLHDYMLNHYNYKMTLFRFPMGEFSEQTLALLQELGYKSVFWSYAYADWDPKKQMEEDTALKKLCDNAHEGAVYLLHAVSKTNDAILGKAIDELQNRGYSLELMTE